MTNTVGMYVSTCSAIFQGKPRLYLRLFRRICSFFRLFLVINRDGVIFLSKLNSPLLFRFISSTFVDNGNSQYRITLIQCTIDLFKFLNATYSIQNPRIILALAELVCLYDNV